MSVNEVHSGGHTLITVDYETAKPLAEQRGLDPHKLHLALNWYVRDGIKDPGPAVSGSGWSVKRGKIWWNDREDPDRFVLADLYEQAH